MLKQTLIIAGHAAAFCAGFWLGFFLRLGPDGAWVFIVDLLKGVELVKGEDAAHMMTYAGLWCGFLGLGERITGVREWMEGRLIHSRPDLGAIDITLERGIHSEMSYLIEKSIQRFWSATWVVFFFMLLYLIFLTLFPNRSVALEERILVVMAPLCPVCTFWLQYSRIQSTVRNWRMNTARRMKHTVHAGIWGGQTGMDFQTRWSE